MSGDGRSWTRVEDEIVRASFWLGWEDQMIADKLNELANAGQLRTAHAVCGRRGELGVKFGKPVTMQHDNYELWCKHGDRRFKLAMIRAVNAGLEHAFYGVIKDNTPINGAAWRYDVCR